MKPAQIWIPGAEIQPVTHQRFVGAVDVNTIQLVAVLHQSPSLLIIIHQTVPCANLT